MSLSEKIKKNKLTIIILIIILVLAFYIRFIDMDKVGYWNDDMTTLPTGVLWFYPHDYYPGLAGQGEPALGNFFVGLGCISSGEDFSGVSDIQPMFYAGREILLGEAMTNSDFQCHLPMYIFGIIFLIIVIILAFNLLDKKGALFFIAFFSFFPFILKYSRWIHVEIILYTFVILGLLFLWGAYKATKESKGELISFILSFAFFALAFATKLPAGLYLLFAIFIVLEKYSDETKFILNKIFGGIGLKYRFKSINDKIGGLIKTLIISIITYIIVVLIPFGFSPRNISLILEKYRAVAPEIAGAINTKLFTAILNFLISLNIIEFLILLVAIYIFFKILLKKNRDKNEKFILYLVCLYLIAILFFKSLILLRVFVSFSFGTILLMSLAFSNKEYSILRIFKKNTKIIFTIFILFFVVFSFAVALPASPYFASTSKLFCPLKPEFCKNEDALVAFYAKETYHKLDSLMSDDETFLGMEGIIYFYIRREQGIQSYLFEQQFAQQVGKYPTLQDKITYFKPDNRTVRYLLVNPVEENAFADEIASIKKIYEPNHIINLKKSDTVWIYDLENLRER